ncbi:MAG: DUF4397 domain-containing protein [Oscillochloridaceae bacterium]|nr:DUF4397 domain-containing protein [Chloroflexaceae bacterium]MDW8391276.1 DUF4397 domain-containing protein [Oscillochloridaceae bacterium]
MPLTSLRRFLGLIGRLAVLLALAGALPAVRAAPLAAAPARVAVLHAAPLGGAAPVTVALRIGGIDTMIGSGLQFAERLPYRELPAGVYPVLVFPGALTQEQLPGATPVLSGAATLQAARDHTLVIGGGANGFPLAVFTVTDSAVPPAPGTATLRMLHAAPFAPGAAATVDVVYENGQAFPGLLNIAFGQAPGPLSVPVGQALDVKIVPTGRPAAPPLLDLPPRVFAAGEEVVLAVIGGAGGQPLRVIEIPRERRVPARVRVLHLAPFASGTAPVHVRVNDTRVLENLAYFALSAELPLEEGSYRLAVDRPGTPPAELAGLEVELERGRGYTVAAIGGANGAPLRLVLLPDLAETPPYGARLRVLHAAPFAPGVRGQLDLRDERNFIFGGQAEMPFGSEALLTVDSGVYRLRFTGRGGGEPVIHAPLLVLPAGRGTTLFVAGDGVNQPFNTLVAPELFGQRVYLPLVLK